MPERRLPTGNATPHGMRWNDDSDQATQYGTMTRAASGQCALIGQPLAIQIMRRDIRLIWVILDFRDNWSESI